MGYTMHQIQKHYNDIVDTYKAMLFREVPCSSRVDYSINGVYRSTDLMSIAKDSVSVRVKLVSKHENLDGLDYPAYFIDLDAEQFVNGQAKDVAHYKRFYCIDNNYYTLCLDDVKHARAVSLKRYLDFWDYRGKSMHIDIKKMSERLVAYLRKAVDMKLGDRSRVYTLRDVYFNYTAHTRKLVVVIKHEDNYATEAFWFDPSLMHMHLQGLIM